jgi:hypothetical protein
MRNKFMIAAFIGLALWAAPNAASAKNSVNTEFKTDLDACCAAPAEDNKGSAIYRKQTSGLVTKQERFRAQAKIDLPSAALSIADETAAAAADVRVILSRTGADYAECSLEFAQVEQETELEDGTTVVVTEAEFIVDVRNMFKKGGLQYREFVGTCDVDLGTAGIQTGVPVVQAGDVATVTLVDPSEATLAPGARTLDKDFLQGTF